MSSGDIANVFEKFNRGKLGSYLFEIAVPVLSKGCKKGEKESCLIYKVLDKAGNKGTGKWASMDALDRGIAVPTITQAVYARYISSEKDVRTGLEKKYTHKHKKPTLSQKKFINLLESALYSSIFSTFAQGFDLIQKTAVEEKWKVDLAEVSRIWEGGCIIRAKLLKVLHTGYVAHKSQDVHVFQLPTVQPIMKKHIPALREFVSLGVATGIPLAGFSSALYYFEAMTKEQLPANVIQGLRDYFGAHTYERVDKKGVFHTDWEE
jgi:6-phosphogluconate dehydrogenase